MATTSEGPYVLEVPTNLKQLARLVVRGFYTVEDTLIIDMLVRNPCMKEDDIAELLRFEKKQLRSRITILRIDKLIHMRLKMETGPDGKAQKVNYYFINYKSFVNVVKYRLDMMRKRMETEERDATSRASFKCENCEKTFTDLEADQLFDMYTQEFRCTYCGSLVEEDSAALPKKDSRLMLARFNDQLQPLYDLLRDVEGIKLAPEILEPEPVDIETIRGFAKPAVPRVDTTQWSGEATRNQGFAVEETRVDINFADEDAAEEVAPRKTGPVWMTESTVYADNHDDDVEAKLNDAAQSSQISNNAPSSINNHRSKRENEDIMSVLLQYEKQQSSQKNASNKNDVSSDSSDADEVNSTRSKSDSESEKEEADVPVVLVAGQPFPIDEINDKLIAQMTPQEKENYIHIYQQQYSHIYD